MSKDRLVDILWADSPPPDHMATLESYVSLLRRRLQPGTPARQSVIRTVPRAYLLDPGNTSTDLDLFDDLVTEADNHPDWEAHNLLDQASALASADLLASSDESWWAEPIRADYRQRAVRAALRASELALPYNADAALRLAGRALGLDVLCEPAWRLMMRAHAATGHRNEALRAYRSCRRLLARELGIKPAPQTRAVLAEMIAETRRPSELSDPRSADLGTVMDATLALFEHQRIGKAIGQLDDAVRVVSALLPHTEPAPVPDLRPPAVVDQQHALRSAATRLHEEFDGMIGPEIIQRFLYASYDKLLTHGTVKNYLPLLAERSAEQRLHTLAAVEGNTVNGTPTVLFRHTPGTGYSRMALGFFVHLAGDRALAWSDGPESTDSVYPSAIAAMAERGIDITGEIRAPWTDRMVRGADVVVTIGHDDVVVPGRRHLTWQVGDVGSDIDSVRTARDEIERRVRALLAELGLRQAG